MTPPHLPDTHRHETTRRPLRRRIAPRLTVLLALVIAAPFALRADVLRHLRLVRSFPAADTTLSQSPDTLRLWLSEPAELPSTRVTLARDTGSNASATAAAVTLGKAKRGVGKNAPILVPVPSTLAPGAYTVSWRTMSRDGHVVKGTIPFRVAPGR